LKKNIKPKFLPVKTIRDTNKVALSSRNSLLNKESYKKAGMIAIQLIALKKLLKKNVKI